MGFEPLFKESFIKEKARHLPIQPECLSDYTGGTWKDALIEGPMCVLLSLSIIWGFEFMGLSPSLAQPVGI